MTMAFPKYSAVIPGLVPGIHVLFSAEEEDVDGQDKPGPDDVSG
jgi:hypothetical protein